MSKLCVTNRKHFAKRMEPNSLLVLFAGSPPVKRGDEFYPFAPQRNFLYMTGIDKPKLIFTLWKHEQDDYTAKLFLERSDALAAKWTGAALGAEEAEAFSGINNFGYTDELDAYIAGLLVRQNVRDVYIDMENRSFDAPLTPDLHFAQRLGERFPAIRRLDAYPLFTALRAVKAKEEIKSIRRAISITRDGLHAMMKQARPGMPEYEIEAQFQYTLCKNGVRRPAFASIIASGANAAVLHYAENNCMARENDLVLCDLGAQVNWYSADITRTFPVGGVFTERQKQLYNIVLEAQKRVIAAIKPGVAFASLNEIVLAYYAKELRHIGLIEKKDEVSRYYYHGVSHMLGLETHDIGRGAEGELKKGMVFTVEPGLYLAEEGIGIRIEDDVLVTENGCEVLSEGIVKTVEEIEALMARKGRSYVGEI